jgi:uncharacterized DUF497 family protein
MDFEFDPSKSEANKIKHGIDFEEARGLWKDEEAVEIPSTYQHEERYLVIAVIEEIYWTAIITCRDLSVRFISVRRSKKLEVELYDNHRGIR